MAPRPPQPLVALVPFLHVADVRHSVEFYQRMGFRVTNTVPPAGTDPLRWAWLEGAGASLMVAQADRPVIAEEQGAIFYLYCDDVTAMREALIGAGVPCGPITTPPYRPQGEFRLRDPDGYAIMITHS